MKSSHKICYTKELYKFVMTSNDAGVGNSAVHTIFQRYYSNTYILACADFLCAWKYYTESPFIGLQQNKMPPPLPNQNNVVYQPPDAKHIGSCFVGYMNEYKPLFNMLIASLGGRVLKTDHTCKVPMRIYFGTERDKVVKFLYVMQNEKAQIISYAWCRTDGKSERAKNTAELWNRFEEFGGAKKDDKTTQPQFCSDLCCLDKNIFTEHNFIRTPVLDVYHLLDRFKKGINYRDHPQLGCMLASAIGVAIMGKEEGSVGKCNEGDKIREKLYNVKQKYIRSGVWTKELHNIMMEQDKHFDQCLNLDDDMPLLIRKSAWEVDED